MIKYTSILAKLNQRKEVLKKRRRENTLSCSSEYYHRLSLRKFPSEVSQVNKRSESARGNTFRGASTSTCIGANHTKGGRWLRIRTSHGWAAGAEVGQADACHFLGQPGSIETACRSGGGGRRRKEKANWTAQCEAESE